MEEQLVNFDTALLAKQKGFNIPTLYFYLDRKIKYNNSLRPRNSNAINGALDVSAPTQSLLQKYLREVHNILIDVIAFYVDNQLPLSKDNLQKPKGYFYWNCYDETFNEENSIKFDTYEKALEAGLQEGLKLIK